MGRKKIYCQKELLEQRCKKLCEECRNFNPEFKEQTEYEERDNEFND